MDIDADRKNGYNIIIIPVDIWRGRDESRLGQSGLFFALYTLRRGAYGAPALGNGKTAGFDAGGNYFGL